MVVSDYIKCVICEKNYRVRIGVGFDEYQKHYFDCVGCEQPIVIALKAKAPHAWVESCENCTSSQSSDENIVLNFHPNCSFTPEDFHNPFSFASTNSLFLIQPHVRVRPGSVFQDVATQFDVPGASALWSKAKILLSLEGKSGNEKSIEKLLKGYNLQRKKSNPTATLVDGKTAMNDLLDGIFYPRINDIFNPVKDLINKLQEDNKLSDFYAYYKEHLQKENLERYLSVLSDYFRYRDHFGQLVFHARVYDENIEDRIVGSKGFEHIKLYYGQVFEAITSNFTILACLNNIESGRTFDTFKAMTLSKYIKDVEKSKKHNPFSENPKLNKFCENIDSALRNGSHHASIWRDGEKVMYRSGGTGAQHDIPYTKYLHICNKLTISLAALFLVELHMQEINS